ncbi:MAG: lamin tail domain-containing protein [Planctomycetota bacterium]|nr:lamin tail domain-containing protein [Planctomycetota bacterium]
MFISSLLLGSLMIGSGENVVINEFSYDSTSTDVREFVELYNPTAAAIDISGWELFARGSTTSNKIFAIPASTSIAAGGFYVLGSALVPNVDQVVGVSNIWQNSQECITLKDAKDGNIVDTLVYEGNRGFPAAFIGLQEGECIWGNGFSDDASHTSWSRVRDGHDTDNNGLDFMRRPATPGKTNNLPTSSYVDLFDRRTVESALPDMGASFVVPHVIDPTKVSTSNPNAITASPQGKNAAVSWDPTGSGNFAMVLRDAGSNVTVEAYVYFDANLEASNAREVWSLGVQGTCGSFYNFPDPSGAFGDHSNGLTGVALTFEVTDSHAVLYLVDHNDGGRIAGTKHKPKTDRVVLGKINLKPTDTGWHRLRLEVQGNTASAYFGGTYGSTTTGQKLGGKLLMPSAGDVYIGYRETVTDNTKTRPFTFDHLSVFPGASGDVSSFGTVKSTTKGTPRVGTNGAPVLGNASFQVTGGGLVPGPNPSLFFLGVPAATPLNLAMFGGQTGSFLYIALTPLVMLVAVSDANGDAALPLPLPNDKALKGFALSVQILDTDSALTTALKFGNSDGLTFKIGG